MADETPIDRIKAALAGCAHPRGNNWTPHPQTRSIRNPCVELYSCDIAAVCDSIPEDKRDAIVNDLAKGQEDWRDALPPKEVHIHVDDAHHLVDIAEGREPPPHNRFGVRGAVANKRPVPTIGEVMRQRDEANKLLETPAPAE